MENTIVFSPKKVTIATNAEEIKKNENLTTVNATSINEN
jgi:hypothetical protein